MASKVGEESEGKCTLAIFGFIVCEILGIVLTTAIHYKILTDNSPGYPFDSFISNFLWMDILIGLGVGFGIFVGLIVLIMEFSSLREGKGSTK